MSDTGTRRSIRERRALIEEYRIFSESYAAGSSPLYAVLAGGVAKDGEILDLLLAMPRPKRQPNLLLAATRLIAGTAQDYPDFRRRLLSHRRSIVDTMLARRTQTNEPARSGALYPVLAALPQPVALIEVGASAGLCLLPDRYAYEYADGDGPMVVAGDAASPVRIGCRVEGPWSAPAALDVAWRCGIDIAPVDLSDPDQVTWLETLIWPGHDERLHRLREAIHLAKADPPRIVAGDLNDRLPEVASEARAATDATLVVFHTAVLPYVSRVDRQRFVDLVRAVGARWLAQEAPDLLPGVPAVNAATRPDAFVLALDGVPLAHTLPHGGWVNWLVDPAHSYR